jgi:cytochrome c-type biogenesis protein CcmH/NrfG
MWEPYIENHGVRLRNLEAFVLSATKSKMNTFDTIRLNVALDRLDFLEKELANVKQRLVQLEGLNDQRTIEENEETT